jgi:hypothetical protein
MTNVVLLPTASKRKVRQPSDAAGRNARMALRTAQPWPGQFVFPAIRTMEKQWADDRAALDALAAAGSATVIGAAIYAVLDEAQRARVRHMLASRAVAGCDVFGATVEALKSPQEALERGATSVANLIAGREAMRPYGDDAAWVQLTCQRRSRFRIDTNRKSFGSHRSWNR